MSVNPAYAGSTSSLEAVLIHRSQWIGISGAPQTQSFTIHSPIANDKMGIGFSVYNDKLGPSDELRAEGNFSYTIAFANEKKLAFGLKFGAKMFNVDWTKGRYYDPMDALLNTNINNEVKPSVGTGLYYYSDKWYVGAAIPNFIRGNYYDDVQESVLVDRLHYYLIGGYVFDFSDNIKFKPSFLFKAVSGAPVYYNVSANFLFSEKVTVGAAYQKDDSVSLLTGFQINTNFYIGYSYDYTTTDLNKYNDGSHEFILRYSFQKKSRQIKSPRFF
jgi:type IX secretion system PorP/SprF family membrane protein